VTKAERELKRYLELLRDCGLCLPHGIALDADAARRAVLPGWHYKGPADLLLREGQFYPPPATVHPWKHALPQACFRNAALYAIEHGMRYVEGYAGVIIPVHHGWCVDAHGRVIEVTWKEPGYVYFGVEFPPCKVMKGAVLFNPRQGTKLYRKPLAAR
jgi:hypothetical protein